MNIPNQEHFEARQAEINKQKEVLFSKLDTNTRELMLEADALSQKFADNNLPHVFFIDTREYPNFFKFVRYNYMFKQKHEDLFTEVAKAEGLTFATFLVDGVSSWLEPLLQSCFLIPFKKDAKQLVKKICSDRFDETYKNTIPNKNNND